MEKHRALLKYRDAPPSVSGLEVQVYLAADVDAKIKEYDDDNVALSQSVVKLGHQLAERDARIAELEQILGNVYAAVTMNMPGYTLDDIQKMTRPFARADS